MRHASLARHRLGTSQERLAPPRVVPRLFCWQRQCRIAVCVLADGLASTHPWVSRAAPQHSSRLYETRAAIRATRCRHRYRRTPPPESRAAPEDAKDAMSGPGGAARVGAPEAARTVD